MKLRELESALSDVRSFDAPVAELEQYPTSAHLASQLLHIMDTRFDDVTDRSVCDLGCGTGMLSIGAAVLGAAHVLAIDVDPAALRQATENAADMDVADVIDFVRADVTVGDAWSSNRALRQFDTVVMNPPFGTKRKGVDIVFLQTAVHLARTAVYTMHKTSTRKFIANRARNWGVAAEVLAELRFDIGRMYKFHRSQSVDVEVDLWRLDVSGCSAGNKASVPRPLPPPPRGSQISGGARRGSSRGGSSRARGRGIGRGGGKRG